MGRGKGRDRKKARQQKRAEKRPTPRSQLRTYKDEMGIYQEYIGKQPNPVELDRLRKEQLARIEQELDAHAIVYASRISPSVPAQFRTELIYEDFLPFVDLLDGMSDGRVAVILETPGGSGETARDIVEVLHERFSHVSFVIPGMAKSAGTIMALGAHEILMGRHSSLGPIDAQLLHEGKQMSADELLKGLDRIKREVKEENSLSLAYVPFLQRLSPGEIEHAINALDFARDAVREWLVKYKFANWTMRATSGALVTEEYKQERAARIAQDLSDQTRWKSHGRSLRIADLAELGVKVEDYGARVELNDAITRYYALLRVTFDAGTAYKLFETTKATVARLMPPRVLLGPGTPTKGTPTIPAGERPKIDPSKPVKINGNCPRCGTYFQYQLDFQPGLSLEAGSRQFPDSGHGQCVRCGFQIELQQIRADLERHVGRAALSPQPKR